MWGVCWCSQYIEVCLRVMWVCGVAQFPAVSFEGALLMQSRRPPLKVTGSLSCAGSGAPFPAAGLPVFDGDVPERVGLLCGELPRSLPRGTAVSTRPQFCPGGVIWVSSGIRAADSHRSQSWRGTQGGSLAVVSKKRLASDVFLRCDRFE